MCSIIVINQHYKQFPLVIAANHDEALSKKILPPQALSNDPHIFGEKDDRRASFLAVNQHSLFAAITSQGPKNLALLSPSLVVLEALKAKMLDEMISLVEELNPAPYNKFNLIFGNSKAVFVAHSYILHSMVIDEMPKGVNLITSDMKFNIQTDDKRAFIHQTLDTHKDTPWPEYYSILKSVLADTESEIKIVPKKNKEGKASGRCTRSSHILAFNDELARFKYFERTAIRPKTKEGEPKPCKYKDYIDQYRELIGAKKIETADEENSDKTEVLLSGEVRYDRAI